MKKGLILLSSIPVFIIGAALIYIAPHFSTPKFIITNTTNDKVTILAKWRTNEKDLGILMPGKTTELKVNDEASMQIVATFSDGMTISSTPVYFTAGMVYKINVLNNTIDTSFE